MLHIGAFLYAAKQSLSLLPPFSYRCKFSGGHSFTVDRIFDFLVAFCKGFETVQRYSGVCEGCVKFSFQPWRGTFTRTFTCFAESIMIGYIYKWLTGRQHSSSAIEQAEATASGDVTDTQRGVTGAMAAGVSAVGRRMMRCIKLERLVEAADDDSTGDDDNTNKERQQTTHQRSIVIDRLRQINMKSTVLCRSLSGVSST